VLINTGRAASAAPASAAAPGPEPLTIASKSWRDDAEGVVALEFAGPGPQHRHRRGGLLAHLGQQPGLTDPGRPVDQDQVPLAVTGGCDRLRQGGGLLLAFDDRGGGRRHGSDQDKGRG
jgi:hypothetical protein